MDLSSWSRQRCRTSEGEDALKSLGEDAKGVEEAVALLSMLLYYMAHAHGGAGGRVHGVLCARGLRALVHGGGREANSRPVGRSSWSCRCRCLCVLAGDGSTEVFALELLLEDEEDQLRFLMRALSSSICLSILASMTFFIASNSLSWL